MFRRSQRLYDEIYAWKDYRRETATLHAMIQERNPRAASLLDVACGTGRHLELLRPHYQVEGMDLDPAFLEIAGERLPGVPLHLGDMSDFDLGRTFDVVTCLFSSIAYTRTEGNLRRAVASFAGHTRPGGIIVIEPWFTPEQWTAGHVSANFVDQPDRKVARISLSGELADPMTLTFHYLVGTLEGIQHFTEDHVVGMFTHEQYLEAFRAAGMEPEHDPEGLMGRGLYIGRR